MSVGRAFKKLAKQKKGKRESLRDNQKVSHNQDLKRLNKIKSII